MHYVYILRSQKDNKFYTGYTNDLKRRLYEHNNKQEVSTKIRVPFTLLYYEACITKNDAIAREKYLKSGMGKKYIRNRLKIYLQNL